MLLPVCVCVCVCVMCVVCVCKCMYVCVCVNECVHEIQQKDGCDPATHIYCQCSCVDVYAMCKMRCTSVR